MPTFLLSPRDVGLAALTLRLILGINFFLHGITRLPALGTFADKMSAGFEGTWMPVPLARATGYVIPIVEAVLGVLLLLGFRLRETLLATAGLLFVLHLGTGLKQEWNTMGSQLVYAIAVFALLGTHPYDPLTLDRRLRD